MRLRSRHDRGLLTYTVNDGRGRTTTVTPATNGAFETGHTDGELWGGQAGCNYQLKPGIVIGVEASGTFDWAKDTFTTELVTAAGRTHVTNITTEIERKCQVHLGPRLGATLPGGNGETLALAPLFYATGGYAGTCYRSKQSGDPNFRVNNPDVSESDFISGWFVGAGVDIPTSGFIPGTFVQIEYSHAEYGDMTFRLAGSDTTGRLDNNANEIRVGFKHRFPDPTPTPLPVPR